MDLSIAKEGVLKRLKNSNLVNENTLLFIKVKLPIELIGMI